MYAEVRITPCKLHKEQMMRGLHYVTLQTLKKRFVFISQAALPSGGESLNVQLKDSEAVLSLFSNKITTYWLICIKLCTTPHRAMELNCGIFGDNQTAFGQDMQDCPS